MCLEDARPLTRFVLSDRLPSDAIALGQMGQVIYRFPARQSDPLQRERAEGDKHADGGGEGSRAGAGRAMSRFGPVVLGVRVN